MRSSRCRRHYVRRSEGIDEEIFRRIPRGPVNHPAQANVPTLAAAKTIVMKDRVPAVEISASGRCRACSRRSLPRWTSGRRCSAALPAPASTNPGPRREDSRRSLGGHSSPFHRVGFMEIDATVKPGVDPKLVEKRLDEVVADSSRTARRPTSWSGRASANMSPGQVRRTSSAWRRASSTLARRAALQRRQRLLRQELERYATRHAGGDARRLPAMAGEATEC